MVIPGIWTHNPRNNLNINATRIPVIQPLTYSNGKPCYALWNEVVLSIWFSIQKGETTLNTHSKGRARRPYAHSPSYGALDYYTAAMPLTKVH